MRNIKLTIEYDGTNYCGWQVQNRKQKTEDRKRKTTIQETLERALGQLLQEKVKVIGSGRTDAGVHALGQVGNFRTKKKLACRNIHQGLNALLPEDIRIKEVEEVHLNFHSRFLAKSKLYCYTIINDSFISPHLRHFAYLVKFPLDVKKMRQGASYFLGKHNFASFQAADKKVRPAVRTIKSLNIHRDKEQICIEIEANGFLYRMARNIAGTLLEIGRGKLEPENIKQILRAKDRSYAGPCAPAKGLCLMGVKYKKNKNSLTK